MKWVGGVHPKLYLFPPRVEGALVEEYQLDLLLKKLEKLDSKVCLKLPHLVCGIAVSYVVRWHYIATAIPLIPAYQGSCRDSFL